MAVGTSSRNLAAIFFLMSVLCNRSMSIGDDSKRHNWTGLLAEPDPENFEKLVGNHRKATLLPHCFSTKSTPEVVEYNARGTNGEKTSRRMPKWKKPTIQGAHGVWRQCLVDFNFEVPPCCPFVMPSFTHFQEELGRQRTKQIWSDERLLPTCSF